MSSHITDQRQGLLLCVALVLALPVSVSRAAGPCCGAPTAGKAFDDGSCSAGYRADPDSGLLDITLDARLATVCVPNLIDKQNEPVMAFVPTYCGQLTGPVLKIKKGDRLRIKVTNNLDPARVPPDRSDLLGSNVPHGFAVTNLHTHGMHVSPRRARTISMPRSNPAAVWIMSIRFCLLIKGAPIGITLIDMDRWLIN